LNSATAVTRAAQPSYMSSSSSQTQNASQAMNSVGLGPPLDLFRELRSTGELVKDSGSAHTN
ncbi:unnamed protein product, partial [Amoebophrya sp. A25]